MYKVFRTIDELYDEIEKDKNWTGVDSATRNRYPLRFVLFDNFKNFNEFVNECTNHCVFVQSLEKWMDDDYDDQMVTHSQLARRIEDCIKKTPARDFVIAPFSEITRFYDNKKYSEFDSLVKTIRLIQAPGDSQESQQRVYVPIIGMQHKISRFKDDPSIHIWEYHSSDEEDNYQLILTRGTTYGVKGLEEDFTLCQNMKEWIELWRKGSKIKKHIICSSEVIFDNAGNAQPDNAFDYIVCHNSYDFLKNGLHIDFGNLNYKKEETDKWNQLASQVNFKHFDFDEFVYEHFNTLTLNTDSDFVNAWFDEKDAFSRWLLKLYYIKEKRNECTYLNRVLLNCSTYSTSELFSELSTRIFEEPFDENEVVQRHSILCEAAKRGVSITELAEKKVNTKLEAIASDSERGYYDALRYLTPLTLSEKLLMVKWVGSDKITREDIKDLFPELYYYLIPYPLQIEEDKQWINSYFNEYRKSKIGNNPNEDLLSSIKTMNASPASFESWRNKFKTVKTLLSNRNDIEVFYWIDGLGVDWIPFITKIIEEHKVDGVYLNEIHIATAEIPTCTDKNKIKLADLSPEGLEKIGDIDSYAHSQKKYPDYVVEEIRIVKESISRVLSQYNGKKLAFISDHGISYMASHAPGLNLSGIKANHDGRCGTWENGVPVSDNKYLILDDNKTICSLTHSSLTTKTPDGHGAHGGITPEEVLVPIIIVSGQKKASNYSAKLIENVISATNPVVRYMIKGMSNIDVPYIIYNSVNYSLVRKDDNIYESEHLNLEETSRTVTLVIGDFKKNDTLVIKTGVEEDDLFGGF